MNQEIMKIAEALQNNVAMRNLVEVYLSIPKERQSEALRIAVEFLNARKAGRA